MREYQNQKGNYLQNETIEFPVRFEPYILFLQTSHVQFVVLFTVSALCTNQARVHFDFCIALKTGF